MQTNGVKQIFPINEQFHSVVNIVMLNFAEMSLINGFKRIIGVKPNETKRKKRFHNIKMNCDPEDNWELIGVLGDGAFGTVYKVNCACCTNH